MNKCAFAEDVTPAHTQLARESKANEKDRMDSSHLRVRTMPGEKRNQDTESRSTSDKPPD
jgi:hypothetical protein